MAKKDSWFYHGVPPADVCKPYVADHLEVSEGSCILPQKSSMKKRRRLAKAPGSSVARTPSGSANTKATKVHQALLFTATILGSLTVLNLDLGINSKKN